MRSTRTSVLARPARRVAAVVAVAVAATIATVPAALGEEVRRDEPARGLVYRGLSAAGAGTPCAGGFEVVGTGHCSHGPDAPPPGLDVTRAVAPVAGTTADVGPHGVVCEGDGQAGRRVQVLYGYPAGQSSRFATYLTSFRTWAAGVDAIYEASAQQTGGSRHVRFVTTADCRVDVREVQFSGNTLDDFNTMMLELARLGYDRTDRKYMVFSDVTKYCGIGSFAGDETRGARNASNGGPSYGRTDAGCWGASIAAHELGHNLGAVNGGAPNSSGAAHCVDEFDVMCYQDRPETVVRTVCTDAAQDQRLDCNHDDYFHTAPSPGSYLATRWNMADSQYLIGAPAS
ncbi:MAG TPA: zinc-dependent metalloprotease family protein [Pilimelia sp.]|nr:zinc-dependent metalloprotease family protein [Pilimelia sp.]